MLNIIQQLIPNLNFILLQSLAITILAMLMPKLKITSIAGPILTVIVLSYINDTFWDEKLFFSVPDAPELKALYLILVNALIFYVLVKILPGIEISGIVPALVAPLYLVCSTYIIKTYFHNFDIAKLMVYLLNILTYLKTYFLGPESTNL